MKKFGFYLLGKKGYNCLVCFVNKFGKDAVGFVVLAKDQGVKSDYYQEITEFCKKRSIDFYDRSVDFSNKAHVSFAIGWRWLIKDDANLIVFHDSLLPRYRGFAPLVNMLIAGETKIGVTALYASKEYDSGRIIDQKYKQISFPIKICDAIDIVSDLYEVILLKITEEVVSGVELPALPQDESSATYSLWRNDNDYEIKWEREAEEIRRFVDSVGYPYSGAKTKINGQWVRVFDVEVVEDVKVESRCDHLGKVIFYDDKGPTVVCGKGLIKLVNITDCAGNSVVDKIPFRTRFGG